MQRKNNIHFIPNAFNFSELGDDYVNNIVKTDDELENFNMELVILNMLSSLKTDKEKCVFFVEVLRELGYNFDYSSAAKSLNICLRWYMRVKKKMKENLNKVFSHINTV